MKIFIFHDFKDLCILHAHVFVMICNKTESVPAIASDSLRHHVIQSCYADLSLLKMCAKGRHIGSR